MSFTFFLLSSVFSVKCLCHFLLFVFLLVPFSVWLPPECLLHEGRDSIIQLTPLSLDFSIIPGASTYRACPIDKGNQPRHKWNSSDLFFSYCCKLKDDPAPIWHQLPNLKSHHFVPENGSLITLQPLHLYYFFIFYFIHMCIQCLGHFSPTPPPPPLPPIAPLGSKIVFKSALNPPASVGVLVLSSKQPPNQSPCLPFWHASVLIPGSRFIVLECKSGHVC
jgi:hypothetical protein